MRDPESPRSATITYALFGVALRLTSAQCGVFTLWYSRRAYERSRGEMITMLYEKTLNRKIQGAKQPKEESPLNEDATIEVNGHAQENGADEANGSAGRGKNRKRFLPDIRAKIRNMFKRRAKTTSKPEDDAASMGKILNLMR